jgi:hypothetical protein
LTDFGENSISRSLPFGVNLSIAATGVPINENSILQGSAICDYSDRLLAGKKNGLTLVTPARSGEEESQTLTAYRGSYGRCKQANRLG